MRKRSEIEGLRAIAVAAVLLYHLWPARLTGGFVGVDVFFVISGFLITSHLVRELERTGTVDLVGFWLRRVRRLLPAALLVLACSAVAVVALAPLSRRGEFLSEIAASALSFQNWVLAANAVDYLSADDLPSPVQHYWTLSVEEQFYIALPIVLLVVGALCRRRGIAIRRPVIVVMVVTVVAGLAYSMWLTEVNAPVAYFSSATRAWEFAVGGLLALSPLVLRGRVAGLVSVIGLAAIVVAVVAYGPQTPFPSYTAALPVLGTAAVIAGGAAGPVWWLSRLSVVSELGRLSYSVYLWHWPIIVMVPFAVDRPLVWGEKLVVIVVTVALAAATTRFVESPVRFSPLFSGARGRRLVAIGAVVAVVAVSGGSIAGAVVSRGAVDRAEAVAESADIVGLPCVGASAMADGTPPCSNPDLGDLLVPAPSAASEDDANRSECWSGIDSSEFRSCLVGSDDPTARRVLAIGDSHNNVYLSAYDEIGTANGWSIEVAGHSSCYWTAREQESPVDAQREACTAWKASAQEHIDSAEPYDLIIVTNSLEDNPVIPFAGETVEEATIAGLHEAWGTQLDRGTPVVAIRDTPIGASDVVECVEQSPQDANDRCALPRDAAFHAFDGTSAAATSIDGADVVDLSDLICTADRCLTVIGNVVVYRDPSHLTDTFARSLAPYLNDRLTSVLAELDDRG